MIVVFATEPVPRRKSALLPPLSLGSEVPTIAMLPKFTLVVNSSRAMSVGAGLKWRSLRSASACEYVYYIP